MSETGAILPRVSNKNWTLSYGMFSIPFGLTKLFNERDKVPGKTLCPVHESPLSQVYICGCDECKDKTYKVAEAHKGFEYEKGKYVILSDDEKAALPADHDGIIEVVANIPRSEVDGDIFEGSYLAIPHKGRVQERNFAITLAYLLKHNRAFVGKGTWYGSTRAFVVEARTNGFIIVHLCNYIANLRATSIEQVSTYPLPEVGEAEIAMAEMGFGMIPDQLDWNTIQDTYVARQREVIWQKVNDGFVPVDKPPVIEDVPDLLEAMRVEMERLKQRPQQKEQDDFSGDRIESVAV